MIRRPGHRLLLLPPRLHPRQLHKTRRLLHRQFHARLLRSRRPHLRRAGQSLREVCPLLRRRVHRPAGREGVLGRLLPAATGGLRDLLRSRRALRGSGGARLCAGAAVLRGGHRRWLRGSGGSFALWMRGRLRSGRIMFTTRRRLRRRR